jgi:cytochrome oxidase Cu insertion factor (SCO1/SenC/PrrC family)
LLLFGYRSCPDTCPRSLSRIAAAYEQIERARLADHLRTVFVSIDPERDTPEALAEYLSSFAVPVVGVTGEPAALERTVQQWGAFVRRLEPNRGAGERRFEHTEHLYLVDTVGRVRHLFRPDDPPERIAGVIGQLMDQEGCLPRTRR